MALNRGKVNPLNVLGLRKLSFIPEHFTKITIRIEVDDALLEHWINYNLNGRYAVIKTLSLDNDKKITEVLEIGMEDPSEISMLTLGCSYLHEF